MTSRRRGPGGKLELPRPAGMRRLFA